MVRWWRVLLAWVTGSLNWWIEDIGAYGCMWNLLKRLWRGESQDSGRPLPQRGDLSLDAIVNRGEQQEDPDLAGAEPMEIPVDGVLDLHCFRPDETIGVLEDYLECCIEKGIPVVRVIHGKGKGVQMRRVHAFLKNHPMVTGFGLDSTGPSGWGATIVSLRVRRDDVSSG
ncbi:MAG: Smr/MutS family protein [Opitutales bacterium]|nr:Smr/MutS family protein [Opitutales bacterium]